MRVYRCFALGFFVPVLGLSGCSHAPARLPGDPLLHASAETRLDSIRQLTRDGQNLEGRWSFDGTRLVFLRRARPESCAQVVSFKTDATGAVPLSDGKNATGAASFTPDGKHVLFSKDSATKDEKCAPDAGDLASFPSSYQLASVNTDGTDLLPLEPGAPRAYNSELAVCKNGNVIFTSDRDGDLELYRGKLDRQDTLTDVTRLTHLDGYDGHAAFSPDCQKITWQASRPRDEAEAAEDKALLKQHLVKTKPTEIWVAHADGSHAHQITRLNAKSTGPVFLPDGERILFTSNTAPLQDLKSDLYLMHSDGTRMERVSFADASEKSPMFSPDGKTLAFSSSRNTSLPGTENLLLADWIDSGAPPSLTLMDPAPENRFKALVEKLSAPEFEGRALETAGLTKAESLIADQFTAAGLKPWNGEQIAVGHNIVGTWGSGCRKKQPVVIGAADSNTSGVAALLETARIIEASGVPESASCFIFAAFTGEENGSAGSSRLVAQLKSLKIRPKAMLNLDTVGSLENAHLIVFGAASGREWPAILAPACANERLRCEESGDADAAGDQVALSQTGVPVLRFFSGAHAGEHPMTVTQDQINATGAIQISHVAAAVAIQAGARKQVLHFLKSAAAPNVKPPTPAGSSSGHGSYLGTIPDYASLSTPRAPGEPIDPDQGVRLAGAHPGSPASNAGIKAGDIVIGIEMPPNPAIDGGKIVTRRIRTLEDFMAALQKLSPGDTISLHVRRGAKILSLSTQVGKR